MNNNLGNKETMAKNIKKYLHQLDKTPTDLSNAIGIPITTISNWLHANTYPRIDKIELMADYFHCTKADLVEEESSDISLSDIEKEIILNYRKSEHQEAILTLLGISPKKSDSELSNNVG